MPSAIRGCGPAAVPEVTFTGHTEESREREECWRARIRLSPCADGPPVVVDLRLRAETVREPSGYRELWTIIGLDLAGDGIGMRVANLPESGRPARLRQRASRPQRTSKSSTRKWSFALGGIGPPGVPRAP